MASIRGSVSGLGPTPGDWSEAKVVTPRHEETRGDRSSQRGGRAFAGMRTSDDADIPTSSEPFGCESLRLKGGAFGSVGAVEKGL